MEKLWLYLSDCSFSYTEHIKIPALHNWSLTSGLAHEVLCETSEGPWSGHTAAGAPWWSYGQKEHHIAYRPLVLCELCQCLSACPCHTPQWCLTMGQKGQSEETYTQKIKIHSIYNGNIQSTLHEEAENDSLSFFKIYIYMYFPLKWSLAPSDVIGQNNPRPPIFSPNAAKSCSASALITCSSG